MNQFRDLSVLYIKSTTYQCRLLNNIYNIKLHIKKKEKRKLLNSKLVYIFSQSKSKLLFTSVYSLLIYLFFFILNCLNI